MPAAMAHEQAPARRAPLEDIWPAALIGLVSGCVVLAVGFAHRRRKLVALTRLSEFARRTSGRPAWASVPLALTTVSLLIAAFGFYWDVSWHIDRGRDPGPLANPAHWLIIIGLAGI